MIADDLNLQMSNPKRANSVSLSPITAYYVHKLLANHFDRLTPITSGQAEIDASLLSDLSLGIVHLDAIDQATSSAVLQLERRIMQHQALSSQGAKHLPDLRDAEQEIFRLLGFNLSQSDPHATILIIDDTPDVLRFLSEALTQQGYEVCSALDGGLALNQIHAIAPDLILLDVMMPGVDGYEVCERLKANPLTKDIPVIFISAIGNSLDKVKGFNLGGVDYVTKPFQTEEVLARIEHQLNLRNLQKRLEEQNLRLQQELQTQQTVEETYRSIFENASIALFQSTPSGRFVRVNHALAQLLGYDSPQAVLQEIDQISEQLYVNPKRRSQLITYLQQFGVVNDFESQIYRKDGTIIWVCEDIRVVKDHQGNPLLYEGIVKDVSDRKQAEDLVCQQQTKADGFLIQFLFHILSGRNSG